MLHTSKVSFTKLSATQRDHNNSTLCRCDLFDLYIDAYIYIYILSLVISLFFARESSTAFLFATLWTNIAQMHHAAQYYDALPELFSVVSAGKANKQ